MTPDDAVRKRQAEAGAFSDWPRGKKRIKYSLLDCVRNPATIISKFQPHHIASHPRTNRDMPSGVTDRLGSVYQQAHEHLIELLGQTLNQRQRTVRLDDVCLGLYLTGYEI